MHDRDHVHVTAGVGELRLRGELDLLAGSGGVAHRLRVEADVKVRVEARLRPRAGSLQDGIRIDRSFEQLVDLAHRHPRVGADGQERRPRCLRRLAAGDAQEVPRRILDVVCIDGPMRFELLAAVSVTTCVVERDPALPEIRRFRGGDAGQIIECGDRFGDAALRELRDGAVEQRPR